jgi:UDP-glucose 4-epimerase
MLRALNGGDSEESKLQVSGADFDTEDGSCVRDYIHASDIRQAHLLAADRLLADQRSPSGHQPAEYYNLSSARGVSVLEIIAESERVSKVQIKFRLAARRVGDP